jgi:hypothetical protein
MLLDGDATLDAGNPGPVFLAEDASLDRGRRASLALPECSATQATVELVEGEPLAMARALPVPGREGRQSHRRRDDLVPSAVGAHARPEVLESQTGAALSGHVTGKAGPESQAAQVGSGLLGDP